MRCVRIQSRQDAPAVEVFTPHEGFSTSPIGLRPAIEISNRLLQHCDRQSFYAVVVHATRTHSACSQVRYSTDKNGPAIHRPGFGNGLLD
jgi:hypothetical protein